MCIKSSRFITIGILLILSAASEIRGQRTYPEIDTLFNTAIKLGNSNLDSTYAIAKTIYLMSTELHDPYGEVKGRLLAAHYFINTFKLDTARHILNACEAYYDHEPGYYLSKDNGRVRLYQTRLSVRRQEYRLAKIYAKEALTIFRKLGDKYYESEVLIILGSMAWVMDDDPGALSYYLEAYRMKNESPDPDERYAPSLLVNIANVLNRMGQYEKALQYAHQGRRMTVEKNDWVGMPNILNTIGQLHKNANHEDSALFYFQKSIQTVNDHHLPQPSFAAILNISHFYSEKGQSRRANEALKELLNFRGPMPGGVSEMVHLDLAKNYLKLERFDSSIVAARPVFKKVLRNNNKKFIIEFSSVLSEIFEKKKQLDSALYYSKINYAFKDSIYNVDNQKKLSTLYAEMETIASQKEIKLLEQQAEIEKAENRILYISIASGALVTLLTFFLVLLNHRNKEKKQKLINLELRNELDQRKKDLHQQALRMIYINNGLADVEEGLKKIKLETNGKQQDIQTILNSIHLNRSLEKEWDNFDAYFGNVHVGFYEKFNTTFSQLSILEKRLAGLVRMNLTNGEIAGILNIESKSVKMAKYRLKKKIGLNDEQDMNSYLQTFG
jgi:hypothetical protein